MKRYLIILTSLFASIFLSIGNAQALQKVTVILDWFPNPDHAPLMVAQQQGFFRDKGLEVEFISPADPSDPPKMVAAGKADIGITYEPEFIQQVDKKLPLISIGTLIDKPLNCLVALKDGKISTLADLKGKRIGSSGSSGLSSIMLKVMLEKQGLKDKDVEFITVHYGLTQALLSGKVDAVTGMMRNFEVPALELNDHKVETFFPEDNGIPNYSELIFITNTNKAHDKRMPKFMAAIQEAVAYLDAHPEETWQAFIKQYPESNNAVNREAWFATLPYFAEEPAKVNRDEWVMFAKFMQDHQLITKLQPISRYTAAMTLKG
jgi:putative hydroxymethylpyrimidine transport system substrate-binding protein